MPDPSLTPQVLERLWELSYGLLSEEEAAELRAQVAANPRWAQALEEVRQSRRLLASVCRLDGPPLEFQPPRSMEANPSLETAQSLDAVGAAMSMQSPSVDRPPSTPAISPRSAFQVPASRVNGVRVPLTPARRSYHVALGVAASVLLALGAAALWAPEWDSVALSRQYLRLVFSGPAVPQSGAANRYSLLATRVTGQPVEAEVQCTLHSPQNETLWAESTTTDANGRLDLKLPADIPVTTGSRLSVRARLGDAEARLETRLAVSAPRLLTQLTLDKPLYQPGETVLYRSLTLNRADLRCDHDLTVQFEIRDPSGAPVAGSEASQRTESGVAAGAFTIPPDRAGGRYVLLARSPDQAFPDASQEFYVRHYRAPRFKKELEFTRDSYSAGDQVVAEVSAARVEGGAAVGAQVTATATVDGVVVRQESLPLAENGAARLEFALPEEIHVGDGRLAVSVDDGAVAETISKAIPINLGKVNLEFYPEGGDLVAGVDNRVYFAARDGLDAPLSVEGEVVDDAGRQVAQFKTQHEGMGSFFLCPSSEQTYCARLREPATANQQSNLPAVRADLPARLSTGKGVFAADEPLDATVDVLEPARPLLLAAVCRGAHVGQSPIPPRTGQQTVQLPLDSQVGGVIRLTLYDYSQQPPRPVAERLVYRRPQRRLQVSLAEHSSQYAPGEKVRLTFQVTDEQQRPAPALLGVSVVDDAVLSLVDEKTPSLTTHFLLSSQLERPSDLEDADFYLQESPEAAQALDLLLGTQGWRKFVEPALHHPAPLLAGVQLGVQGDKAPRHGDGALSYGGVALEDSYLEQAQSMTPPAAVLDNLDQLQPEYDRAVASSRGGRTHGLAMTAFFGSLLLLLSMLLLGLGQLLGRPARWAPIAVASVASLALSVAGLQTSPQRESPTPWPSDTQVAYQDFTLEPPDVLLAQAGGNGEQSTNHWDIRFGNAPSGYLVVPDDQSGREHAAYMSEWHRFNGRWVIGREGLGALPVDNWADNGVFLTTDDLTTDAWNRPQGAEDTPPILYPTPEVWRWLTERRRRYRPFGRRQFRAYAHRHVRGQNGQRGDFAETLYWNPLLIADARGQASLEFDLSDSITTFRVLAQAHNREGRLGSGAGEVLAAIPFHMEPKLPLEVTAGDRVDVAVAVSNGAAMELPVRLSMAADWGSLSDRASGVFLAGAAEIETFNKKLKDTAESEFNFKEAEGAASSSGATRDLVLSAGERGRVLFEVDVPDSPGQARLAFRGAAGDQSDAVERLLRVSSDGFPVQQSYGGELSGPQELNVSLPGDWIPGSLEVTLRAYPSVLADLQAGLQGMLGEPTGCFEQASSGNYPNVLVLQFMQESQMADPDLTRRARDLLAQGYRRLSGFECPTHGFEWFGADPGHEALTAYGLLQFHDMAQVHQVDSALLARTESWLWKRRDGKGGFHRKSQALGDFGSASQPITDAYIVWALAEAGHKNLDLELRHVQQLARESDDPYLVALVAASTATAQSPDQAIPFLDKLSAAQADDGHLEGRDGSVTRSGGLSLQVETTALAALAWMKAPEYLIPASKAIHWLIAQRRGAGDFGSTQATVLALKAMVSYAKAQRHSVSAGELVVTRHGQTIGQQAIAAGALNAVTLTGLGEHLRSGDNHLQLALTGQNEMPYSLDVRYRSRQPDSDERCPLRISTRLERPRLRAGQTVRLLAEVVNASDQGQPMTVAILGLPAGLEPQPDQLERLRKAGVVDYYETRAREIICYWRGLAPRQKVELPLDLVAEIPGEFTGPASRVYLYYTAEQKQWAAPLKARIDPLP